MTSQPTSRTKKSSAATTAIMPSRNRMMIRAYER